MKILLKTLGAFIKKMLGIWNEPKRYRQLYECIHAIRARNIMEIGTWRGKRAKLMIQEAQKNHPSGQVSYFGFDLFEVPPIETMDAEFSVHKRPPPVEEVDKDLRSTGAMVELFKGDTTEVLPRVIDSLPKMDFIFIDGGHSIATIENDWGHAQRLMHTGTVVVFDDYWPNRMDGGAKPVVDAIDRTQYSVSILPEFDVFLNPDYGRLIIQFAKVAKI